MIRDVPRELWLYKDRGMMKWLGYFLSDHTQYMDDHLKADVPANRLPQQNPEAIDQILQESFEKSKFITVQINDTAYLSVNNFSGIVVGSMRNAVYLQQEHNLKLITLTDIRNVELSTEQSWWAQ